MKKKIIFLTIFQIILLDRVYGNTNFFKLQKSMVQIKKILFDSYFTINYFIKNKLQFIYPRNKVMFNYLHNQSDNFKNDKSSDKNQSKNSYNKNNNKKAYTFKVPLGEALLGGLGVNSLLQNSFKTFDNDDNTMLYMGDTQDMGFEVISNKEDNYAIINLRNIENDYSFAISYFNIFINKLKLDAEQKIVLKEIIMRFLQIKYFDELKKGLAFTKNQYELAQKNKEKSIKFVYNIKPSIETIFNFLKDVLMTPDYKLIDLKDLIDIRDIIISRSAHINKDMILNIKKEFGHLAFLK